jgi:hypothetical protein
VVDSFLLFHFSGFLGFAIKQSVAGHLVFISGAKYPAVLPESDSYKLVRGDGMSGPKDRKEGEPYTGNALRKGSLFQ